MNRRTFVAAIGASLLPWTALAQTPTASPGATPETATYPPLDDVRDIWVRPWSITKPFRIEGYVSTIYVAPEGRGYPAGNENDEGEQELWRTLIFLWVELPKGGTDKLLVAYDDDVPGAYEGDRLVIQGELAGTDSGTNDWGKKVTLPFMIATDVELMGSD